MLAAAFRLERPYQSLDTSSDPCTRAQGAFKIQRAEEEDTGDKRHEPRGEIERAGPEKDHRAKSLPRDSPKSRILTHQEGNRTACSSRRPRRMGEKMGQAGHRWRGKDQRRKTPPSNPRQVVESSIAWLPSSDRP